MAWQEADLARGAAQECRVGWAACTLVDAWAGADRTGIEARIKPATNARTGGRLMGTSRVAGGQRSENHTCISFTKEPIVTMGTRGLWQVLLFTFLQVHCPAVMSTVSRW